MSEASEMASEYPDANDLMTVLDAAGFPKDQDWDAGETTWTLDDGSTLAVCGNDVTTASAEEVAVGRHARQDAATHQEEFPGQRVQGDWDSDAWQFVSSELDLIDNEHESLWPVYRDTLHAEVIRLIDLRNEIVAAVEAADVCCPEQVTDAVLAVAYARGDWQSELAKAIANDPEERKALGIEE